jgi:hypothetical protein
LTDRLITIPSFHQSVLGVDRAILDAIWLATRYERRPYRLKECPRTGDTIRYVMETLPD